MKRLAIISEVSKDQVWDFIVVGGGATGLGIALDAALRGYKTVLFEMSDLAKATSSRSTKLVHGGVRYMAQGDIALVREACHERGRLLQNAPHLTQNMTFIIPNYTLFDNLLYIVGLTFYDFLAGKFSIGRSKYVSKQKVREYLPTVREKGLKGGVLYHDGQFDDARLAVSLAQSAMENGATLLTYAKVTGVLKDAVGKLCGVTVSDGETGAAYSVKGKVVVNATGVFVDDLMMMDNPLARKLVRPSQGVHLVLDTSFLSNSSALMIPKTDDGRVLFAVPWHNRLIVGTTDTLREQLELEPHALEEEVEFILNTAGRYLDKKPTRADVLSVFAGLRPLAAPQGDGQSTKEISRNHKIIVSNAGLVTITGGKWTTYRRMAEDTVNRAVSIAKLPKRECTTKTFRIHGYVEGGGDRSSHLYVYGTDREQLEQLMKSDSSLAEKLVEGYAYTKAEVVWAVQRELARRVDDVLARRSRILFVDARAAIKAAPVVAEVMAKELGYGQDWIDAQVSEFTVLANGYILT